jgi:hypothetical protein
MSLITLLLIILLVLLIVGVGGHGRWGYYGYSPLLIVVIVLLVLYLTGNLALGQTIEWAGEEPPPEPEPSLAPGAQALTLGGALTTLILGVTQLAKWLLTRHGRPSWWGTWAPRVVAASQGLLWAVAFIPSGEWQLVASAAVSGLVAIAAYDYLAHTDAASAGSGGAAIGAVLAACLLVPSSGCGGLDGPLVTYDGIAGQFAVDVDLRDDGDPWVHGLVSQYLTVWGQRVQVDLEYFRGTVAGCVRVGSLPPLCVKRSLP